jgi:hypothetical protein
MDDENGRAHRDSDKTVIRKTAPTSQPSILLSAHTNNVYIYNCNAKLITVSEGSSIGTATRYELNGPGINSRWRGGANIFSVRADPPKNSSSLLYNGYWVFFPG